MSGHTPGPWEVLIDMDAAYIAPASGGAPIARILALHPDAVGNAAVLAAAPDLLAALQDARQFIANGIDLGYIRMPDASTPDSAHKTPALIDAAIAKATQP